MCTASSLCQYTSMWVFYLPFETSWMYHSSYIRVRVCMCIQNKLKNEYSDANRKVHVSVVKVVTFQMLLCVCKIFLWLLYASTIVSLYHTQQVFNHQWKINDTLLLNDVIFKYKSSWVPYQFPLNILLVRMFFWLLNHTFAKMSSGRYQFEHRHNVSQSDS